MRNFKPENLLPELLGGAFVSWLGVTLITHKDPRYSLPALVYMAALGTGWIATAKRWRAPLTTALTAVVPINPFGISTGLGNTIRIGLPGAPSNSVLAERHITLYSPDGWLRGGPEHDGDLLALMRGLKRDGVRTVTFEAASSDDINFNTSGLQVRATEAGLPYTTIYNPGGLGPRDAFILRHNLQPGDPPPCQRLMTVAGCTSCLVTPTFPSPNSRSYVPATTRCATKVARRWRLAPHRKASRDRRAGYSSCSASVFVNLEDKVLAKAAGLE